MARKVWVLDTETKGTGAEVVPLDKVLRPMEWGACARALLARFFRATNEDDRLMLHQLEEGLQCWLEICENALFDEPVSLAAPGDLA